MKISSAKFVLGSSKPDQFPDSGMPEFAFAGRSNVGKSSLINFLTGKSKLARTSSTPGRTREVNFFEINENWTLADLPGYGYAKLSKKEKERIQRLIHSYLKKRDQLYMVFVLVDSRIPPQQIDLDMINDLGSNQIPLGIVFTKADKPGKSDTSKNISGFRTELLKYWEELPPMFLSSSSKKVGKDEILDYIQSVLDSTKLN